MTYSQGHPVRLIGGRLALDFFNTADWTSAGEVAHEKVSTGDDLRLWLAALGLPDASPPENLAVFHDCRKRFRHFFRNDGVGLRPGPVEELSGRIGSRGAALGQWPILDLVTVSALSLLADPREMRRIKTCPGTDCGWMFVDETRNGRRKWCLMETCGNRAKAARHYKRATQERAG